MYSLDRTLLERPSLKAKWALTYNIVEEIRGGGLVRSRKYHLPGTHDTDCFRIVLEESVIPKFVQLKVNVAPLERPFLLLISRSVQRFGETDKKHNKETGFVCKLSSAFFDFGTFWWIVDSG